MITRPPSGGHDRHRPNVATTLAEHGGAGRHADDACHSPPGAGRGCQDRYGLGAVCLTAGRTETYAELVDLDRLIAAYQAALPAELADPECDALDAHRDRTPADYAPRF